MTSRTAWPIAALTGFPPNVLKYSMPLLNDAATSGVEMMRDKNIPATSEVADLMEFALNKGVLLSCDGPDNNVLKIKPPLIVTKSDVDHLLNVFSDWLGKK